MEWFLMLRDLQGVLNESVVERSMTDDNNNNSDFDLIFRREQFDTCDTLA